MKLKLLTVGLLLNLALVTAIAADLENTNSTANTGVPNAPAGPVIAYYFHGTVRCETCLKIEKQSRDFIERRYKNELDAKQLSFQSVNYDSPENGHFLRDYKLPYPSLALVRPEKDAKWKILGQTWTLVETPAAFDEYVEKEVNMFLSGVDPDSANTNSPAVPDSTPGNVVNSLDGIDAHFGEMSAAMVFVQGTNQPASVNWAAMNGARQNLEAEWDIKLGLFELKTTPKDYEHLALRLPTFHPPELMIVLKNGSMTLYSGELTQSNLVQEFVHAVNSGGCCPLGEHE